MADLTCYLLRSSGSGSVSDFDDALDEDTLARLRQVGPADVGGARAKLYLAPPRPHLPEWAPYVATGFGDDLPIPQVSSAAAVMVVRRDREGSDPFFLAFTFGAGWQMLRSSSFVRGFGLRTALNVVFEGDTGEGDLDPARLRSADAKRVGPNILRSRHQVSGVAALEELQVDIRRDLLNAITGIPQADGWGRRVTGRDSLHFAHPSLEDLGNLCDRILAAYEEDSYKERFSFIDQFTAVTDPVTITRLIEEVIATLQAQNVSSLDMAPPEIVDWERIAGFRYHTERGRNPTTRRELRLVDYLGTLTQKGYLVTLESDQLNRWYVWAVDGNGSDVTKWPVWNCLFGELVVDGDTFILDEGDFYLVSQDYLAQLNHEISTIAEFPKDLPTWPPMEHEDSYNLRAAASSPQFLLMDQRFVWIESYTNRIELCDVMTRSGGLIHVKRKRDGSASLSHLFAQGLNAADLIVTSPEFRKSVLERIATAERERADETHDDSFVGAFSIFEAEQVTARDYEIVFAVQADWDSGGFETLPFFSKLTLRNVVDDLVRLGLRVSVRKIHP